MPSAIEKIEAMHDRLQKARGIVANQGVHVVLGIDSHFAIDSTAGNGQYLVNGKCSCSDAKEREDLHNGVCKHRLAVLLWLEADTRTRRGESVPKEW